MYIARRFRNAAILLLCCIAAACGARSTDRQSQESVALATVANAPTLSSEAGRLSVELDVVSAGTSGAPAFSYEGAVGIAPTLRVRPGDVVSITLHNALPVANFTANAVNLHFHGFDVSPNTPQDDVVSMLANPGQTLRYELHVPKTQQPGLYWYHPHSHGEAYWQVMSGMSGAIIVEGLRRRVPEVAGLAERLLILRDVQDHANIFGVPWYARKKSDALEMAAARQHGITRYSPSDPDDVTSGGACAPERHMHVSIEGTDGGNIRVAPGERQIFRVLNASAGRVFDLAVDDERIGLVALDGYPVAAYPGSPRVAWIDHVVVPPAGRAEFIVVGRSGGTVLRPRCYDSGPVGDRDPAVVLAKLEPGDSADIGPKAVYAASPQATQDDGVVRPGVPSVTRAIEFTEDGTGYYINNRAFNMRDMGAEIVVHAGTTERWTVENRTDEIHAFHVHQIHFVTVAVDGEPAGLRYWADTVIVPPQRNGSRRRWHDGDDSRDLSHWISRTSDWAAETSEAR